MNKKLHTLALAAALLCAPGIRASDTPAQARFMQEFMAECYPPPQEPPVPLQPTVPPKPPAPTPQPPPAPEVMKLPFTWRQFQGLRDKAKETPRGCHGATIPYAFWGRESAEQKLSSEQNPVSFSYQGESRWEGIPAFWRVTIPYTARGKILLDTTFSETIGATKTTFVLLQNDGTMNTPHQNFVDRFRGSMLLQPERYSLKEFLCSWGVLTPKKGPLHHVGLAFKALSKFPAGAPPLCSYGDGARFCKFQDFFQPDPLCLKQELHTIHVPHVWESILIAGWTRRFACTIGRIKYEILHDMHDVHGRRRAQQPFLEHAEQTTALQRICGLKDIQAWNDVRVMGYYQATRNYVAYMKQTPETLLLDVDLPRFVAYHGPRPLILCDPDSYPDATRLFKVYKPEYQLTKKAVAALAVGLAAGTYGVARWLQTRHAK